MAIKELRKTEDNKLSEDCTKQNKMKDNILF